MADWLKKAVQCSANSKQSGKRCGRPAIRGGMVCRFHGGSIPAVIAAAKDRLADLIDPDRTLREAARLAFSDVRELFDAEGRMLPVKQWPDHLAAAIAGIEVLKRNIDSKDGKQEDVIKVKVWDKPKNIEMLMRHLGLLNDKLDIRVTGLDQRIRTARDRASASTD